MTAKAMKTAKHLLLFLVCLGFVYALRLVAGGHYTHDLNQVVSEASLQGSREREAVWRRQAYTAFSASDIVSAMSKKVPLASLHFSQVHRAKLELRLLDVLHYFEQPTFDEYYRLKTEGLHWTLQPDTHARDLLADSAAVGPPQPSPTEARDLLRKMWEHVHAGPQPSLPRLTAVCLDSIAGATTHTNSPKALLTGEVKRGYTAAREAIDPGLAYGSGRASTEPLLFELSFLAKANGSEDAGPVYISLLWVEEDQEWALNRLMTDHWLQVKTIF